MLFIFVVGYSCHAVHLFRSFVSFSNTNKSEALLTSRIYLFFHIYLFTKCKNEYNS